MKRGSESNIDEMVRKIKEQFRRKSPVDVFKELFNDKIRKHTVQQSTIYASQKNRHSFVFSDNCLKKLIGFLLLTGYNGLPQEKMYWCEDEDVESDIVRACFSRNRYLEIKRNFHFNDNSPWALESTQDHSKLLPWWERLMKSFWCMEFFLSTWALMSKWCSTMVVILWSSLLGENPSDSDIKIR